MYNTSNRFLLYLNMFISIIISSAVLLVSDWCGRVQLIIVNFLFDTQTDHILRYYAELAQGSIPCYVIY